MKALNFGYFGKLKEKQISLIEMNENWKQHAKQYISNIDIN